MKQGLLALTGPSSSQRTERKAPIRLVTTSTYEPINSVCEGSDGELLEAMFRFYATIEIEPMLDATYNAGRFRKGSSRCVISMDIRSATQADDCCG